MARKMLPAILYKSVLSEEILKEKTNLDRTALYRFGISGGFPITVMDYEGDELKLNTAIAVNEGLAACGVETDLVIFCRTEEDLSRIESLGRGERRSVFPLIKEKLSQAYSQTDECLMSEDIISIMDMCHATGNNHLLWFERLLSNHFEGIIAHATYNISAAKIEGINNKIKTLRRQSYGYPDDEYFFLKLFDVSRKVYVRNLSSHKICD